jgi:hypothetical protein
MNSEAVRNLLHEQPFVPLEVHMSSGKTLMIRHSGCAVVTKNTLFIVDPETEFLNRCSLIDITNIIQVQSSAA